MKTISNFCTIKSVPAMVVILVFIVGFLSCKKDNSAISNGKINYSGTFVKSSDAVVTAATGTVTGTFDPTTMKLSYQITWSGLGSNATAMHFHDNGPVIDEITGFSEATSGTMGSTVTLSNSQYADLQAGKIYVQIHTMNIPAGEIKATLTTSSSSSNYNQGSSGGYGY